MNAAQLLDRLNKVTEPLNLIFYDDRFQVSIFRAHWCRPVSFDENEVARIPEDDKLKQLVIDRTIIGLREQIGILESLRMGE